MDPQLDPAQQDDALLGTQGAGETFDFTGAPVLVQQQSHAAQQAVAPQPIYRPAVPMGIQAVQNASPGMPAYSSTTTRTLPKDYRAAQSMVPGVLDAQSAALGEKTKVAVDLATIQSEQAVKEQKQAAAHEEDRLRVMQEQRARMDEAQARRREAEAKYAGSDIKDFWAQRSTGSRVLAGIAMALGGFAQAYTGHNGAAEIINKAVDDDFRLQRERINNLKDNVAMARTGVLDADQARARLLEEVDIKNTLALQRISGELKARAAGIGPQAERAQGAMQAAELLDKNVSKRLQAADAGISTTTTVRGEKSADPYRQEGDPLAVYGPGGDPIGRIKPTGNRNQDAKSSADASKSVASYRELVGVLDALEKSYGEHGRVNPLGEVAQERQAIASAGTIAYKNMAELGALSGPDMGLVNQALGGGSSVYIADPRAKIAQAKKLLQQKQAQYLDARGLPGARIAAGVLQSGQPKQEQGDPQPPIPGARLQISPSTGARRWVDANGTPIQGAQ